MAESGRGLLTVAALATHWSWTGGAQGRIVRAALAAVPARMNREIHRTPCHDSGVEADSVSQIRRDNLRDIVEAHTSEYGKFTAEETAEARSALYGSAEDERGSAV